MSKLLNHERTKETIITSILKIYNIIFPGYLPSNTVQDSEVQTDNHFLPQSRGSGREKESERENLFFGWFAQFFTLCYCILKWLLVLVVNFLLLLNLWSAWNDLLEMPEMTKRQCRFPSCHHNLETVPYKQDGILELIIIIHQSKQVLDMEVHWPTISRRLALVFGGPLIFLSSDLNRIVGSTDDVKFYECSHSPPSFPFPLPMTSAIPDGITNDLGSFLAGSAGWGESPKVLH